MKTQLILIATVVLSTAIALAAPRAGTVAFDDEPPPEPLDCPLCAGNPAVHARRMLDLEALSGRVITYALRW